MQAQRRADGKTHPRQFGFQLPAESFQIIHHGQQIENQLLICPQDGLSAFALGSLLRIVKLCGRSEQPVFQGLVLSFADVMSDRFILGLDIDFGSIEFMVGLVGFIFI